MATTETTKSELINEEKAARMLGLSVSTLRSWRFRKTGPDYHKIGKKSIRYCRADIEAYLMDTKVTHPTVRKSA